MSTHPADPFRDAVREQIKARVALVGPSKSGKTLAAIGIARGIVGPQGKIALVDTENESSKLYADLTPFRIAKLGEPFHPERYARLIGAVAGWGYDCLIVDSVTPAWSGEGGVMTIVDQAKRRANSTGWDVGNREYQKLVQAVLTCPVHIICTIRAKQKFDYSKGEDGKMQVTKLGVGPEMRDQFDYEFTITGNLQADHVLALDARGDLRGETLPAVDDHRQAFAQYVDLGGRVATWLGAGAPPVATQEAPAAPAPVADATPPAPPAEPGAGQQAAADEQPAPVASPQAAVDAHPEGLGVDPDPAESMAPSSPVEDETQGANGAMTPDQEMTIAAKLAECMEIRPAPGTPWEQRISDKAMERFGKSDWHDLNGTEAQRLIEMLNTTILQMREQDAAKAAS